MLRFVWNWASEMYPPESVNKQSSSSYTGTEDQNNDISIPQVNLNGLTA